MRIPTRDLTDEEDEDDEKDEEDVALTWLMWPWWVMIPIEGLTDDPLAIEGNDEDDEEDLTDVTLVSEDTYWPFQVMKVMKWWKFSSDESYLVMKVV